MNLAGFIGPSYVTTSPNVAIETLYNWFPQTVEVPDEKARLVYAPTPGTKTFAALDDAPLRGLLNTDVGTYAVAGLSVYQLFANAPWTKIGTLSAKDANPVSMTWNGVAGHQVYITSGGFGNILNTTTNIVTPITAAGYPAGTPMGTYLDTYFLTIKNGTGQFNVSGVLDGAAWSSLDFSIRVQASDNLVGIIQNNKIVWLIGSQTSEPWYDAGAATFPFQSVPQILVQTGCIAPFTIARTSGSVGAVVWLSQTERGQGIFVMATGGAYSTQRISTYAQEIEWNRYPTLTDAVSYCYTDQGHDFLVVTFPSGNATWVYDFGEKMWHRRSWRNPLTGQKDRHRGWVHCPAFGMHLIGDWETGVIYQMDTTLTTDDGAVIQRERRAPHISREMIYNFHSNFLLDMETGLGNISGQGSNPIAWLAWSDDGGHTWSDGLEMSAGIRGDYRQRCRVAGSLGQSRDRVYQVTVSDPIPWRLIGAYLDVLPGTS